MRGEQPGHAAPVAPSALRANTRTVLVKDGVPTFVETSTPRALDASELPGIVQDYRHAARNAIACGFDGVRPCEAIAPTMTVARPSASLRNEAGS